MPLNDAEIVDAVIVRPAVLASARNGIYDNPDDLRKGAVKLLPLAISELAQYRDWDFACEVHDHSGGSVAEIAEYTLIGENDDCQNVVNIRYGDDLKLLDKRDPTHMDWLQSGRTYTTVMYWVLESRSNSFPVVRLIDAPSSTENTIKYRYWRNNVGIEDIPEDFAFVLELTLAKKMAPLYYTEWRDAMHEMVRRYTSAGGSDRPGQSDPVITRANNERARLNDMF